MPSGPLLTAPALLAARPTVCRQCLKAKLAATYSQRRGISRKVEKKRQIQQVAWDRKAERIQNGEEYNPWDFLKERGYVKDTAGTDKQIRELMRRKRIGAYVGVDPTAQSLHVGHLLPFMALFWLYLHGYGCNTLIGGGTAKIGDPTDRLQARDKIPRSDLTTNITKCHYQLKRIWGNVETLGARYGFQKEYMWSRALVNNSTWLNSTPFMEVVGRLFKGMRMGPLLSRDTVKRRLEENGSGMPLDEFIYPLVQAWDWWHMYSSPKDVMMQIGGSDQYGNIVSGIEAIKYLRDTEPQEELRRPDDLLNTPVGFTVPLLTDSSGAKFGKSAGNAVWLDPFLTSSFDLYGYFMRRPDADVGNLLRLLTFMPSDAIAKIMEEHSQDPSQRVAQHALAHDVVCLAHSTQMAKNAREQHQAIYAKKAGTTVSTGSTRTVELDTYPSAEPATAALATGFNPDIELPESLVLGKSMGRILYAAGLAASITDGLRLTKQQGAYVAGSPGQASATNKGMTYGDLTFTPIKNWFPADTKNFLLDGHLLILRRGKHFFRIVKMVSDEEYKASGKTYPGMPGSGKFREIKKTLDEMREEGVDLTQSEWRRMKQDLSHDMAREEAHAKGQLYMPGGSPPWPHEKP
ncbi:hypothetical protein JX265_007226 [Neoarthrinium moseri]|uniref:Tyrosine--tRNA ligase n=1 Tax=Neoarthrinium moseri TaxID=1658444 RepID=A0A9Q0ANJ7_9PEZI|nr:uncharacterized protein JN550_011892 [Neoarthrinium moseri]KAI1850901.1 hypothetical protein JX266_003566 [Neoarthrinium moseri]KAI1859697.1 hypothetical protein JN550_011892 [Neoarthrinium moseri]KAI1867424.1 hypothetical protein JX265_007226 [Neoarthrinium moseri]